MQWGPREEERGRERVLGTGLTGGRLWASAFLAPFSQVAAIVHAMQVRNQKWGPNSVVLRRSETEHDPPDFLSTLGSKLPTAWQLQKGEATCPRTQVYQIGEHPGVWEAP